MGCTVLQPKNVSDQVEGANLTAAVCRLLGLQALPANDATPLGSALSIENGARAALDRLMASRNRPAQLNRV